MRRQARISGGGALVVRSASALQVWLWLLIFIFQNEFRISRSIQPGYLDFDNLPETNFTCAGKVIGGYYADLETSCQMFHVCTVGQQDEPMDIKFLCLNGTVFDQETRVCERVDEVDCTKSEKFYSLNLELYGSTAPPIIQPEQNKSETTNNKRENENDPSIDEIYTTAHNKSPQQTHDIPDSTEDPVQDITKDDHRYTQSISSTYSALPPSGNDELTEEYQDEDNTDGGEYEDYSHAHSTTTETPTTTTSKKPTTSKRTTTTTTTNRPSTSSRTTSSIPKRSDDSASENQSSLSARSVAPPAVTERPPVRLKSPPRVIVTASASFLKEKYFCNVLIKNLINMTSSDSSIMSVRDMIDAAFGEPETNVVNHKLIQTILYLLAKQLRLLERHVKVEIGPSLNITSNTSLSITEIKLHAMQKKRSKPGKVKDDKGKIERAKADALSGIKGRSKETKDDKAPEITTTSEKSSSDKSSKHIASSDKTYPENLSSLRPLKETTSEDTSNSAKKMSTEKTSSSTSEKKTTGLKKTRADSREVPQESPTPMASLESVEAQYEKLLIVERVPMEEAKARHGSIMTPTLSVVTQEQFAELEAQIKALQEKLAPTGKADFPENAQLLQELRKGASLTDAMAALQLSARLEAAEKTLDQMLSLLTEVAIKKPNIDQHLTKQIKPDKMDTGLPIASFKAPLQEISVPLASSKTTDATMPTLAADAKDLNDLTILDTSKQNFDVVTRDELKTAMQDLYDEIIKSTNSITAKSTSDAINALKIAKKMEEKLDKSVDLSNRMDDLETLVADYAEQINILDTGLSSQMTNYQEQLTQMQHDLESGLDNMAETLANAGGDTTAVTELNGHFSNLQFDLENMFLSQKELNDNQNKLSVDLEGLWQHIEVLRSTKADREEVADALRDKAGIAALNGLVSLQQFDAVQGDFEKRILTAYDKFNNQEMIWQKAIDDLFRGLNEKADYVQVTSLRDEIQKYLNMFDSRINAMSEILGEPRAAAILRKIHRDSACLSCATPAVMDLEEPGTIPALPALSSRSPGVGAESLNPKEDGDHLCYPRHPIPHQKDSRSHACNRYCGGSHTILNNMSRVPAGMVVTPIIRHVATGLGSDGKVYRLEDTIKPCIPCNTLKANSPRQSTVGKY